ncbi:FAD/NAD(P)-binding domain-containing protein [Punctularia strigosozonata HHB-11173 SS5]|uniref:FAD/NAD(P)-binding domain-containing protein n=1 Tax=Punctularia strigosozonata (strain HHB-11173) TaxID=741275 RepID=R7S2T4_PUNST|nr:FAD/NAD(P)-binding domain-containing protein [Punctularia strigosozonata HHB-11173 SS5]EIN03561.1 FAD/NAD(P)-binding domain-containing protein [Punctularia strigosozonata HHB-11173 SS5]
MSSEIVRIAADWLDSLGQAFASGDAETIVALFQQDGWLRDLLTFSWDFRSLRGTDQIINYLSQYIPSASISNVKLDRRTGLEPSLVSLGPDLDNILEASFTFENASGSGRGMIYLKQDATQQWKAFIVFMTLDELRGLEEQDHESGLYGGHTITYQEVQARRVAEVESDPQVLIVGAGQTGLQVAARFKQMGIRAIVIDKNSRVGDNWRVRYIMFPHHTRALLLYAPFPSTWPRFTPRDKLANWLEQYATSQDLVIWTDSEIVPTPSYDPGTKRWGVRVRRGDTEYLLHPIDIVIATGTLGDPLVPLISGQDTFVGDIMHSSRFPGGQVFTGRRVLVVGAGNTSADLCQDLVHHGAASVTMVQRSSSVVVSDKYMAGFFEGRWPEGVPYEISDFRTAAMPLGQTREILQRLQQYALEYDSTMHEDLRKQGLSLSNGPDGAGLIWTLFSRLGGIDVGCAALIADGKVEVKQGVEVARFDKNGILFSDGTETEADAVLFATGYHNMRDTIRKIFGDIIDKTSPVWGLDDEYELRGFYRPSGQEGLWYAAGDFSHARYHSKHLVSGHSYPSG